MISKIKSKKITYVKILLGVLLAGSLTATFAFESKEVVKVQQNQEVKTTTLLVEGYQLQITGDPVGIEKLKQLVQNSQNAPVVANQVQSKKPAIKTSIKFIPGEGQVFTVVEQMPEFPDGQKAFQDFLMKSVKYPAEAVKKGITGKVYVQFVVGSDGSVLNAKVVRGVDPLLDVEALRVVNSSPKWTPGKQGGKVVASQFTVPINFQLQ